MSMESLMGHLILNEQAGTFACQIPATADVGALADQYALLSCHNDKTSEAACIAIEHHVRNVAIINFHKEGVLEALSIVERSLKEMKKRQRNAKARAKRAEKKRNG